MPDISIISTQQYSSTSRLMLMTAIYFRTLQDRSFNSGQPYQTSIRCPQFPPFYGNRSEEFRGLKSKKFQGEHVPGPPQKLAPSALVQEIGQYSTQIHACSMYLDSEKCFTPSMIACSILGFVISLLLSKLHSIQAPVRHRINRSLFTAQSKLVSLILFRWIVIYPVGSAIQRLNNRAMGTVSRKTRKLFGPEGKFLNQNR